MKVKLRFAPSPTGYIHLGNAKIALMNYLLAKSMGGDFILRIDDTDQERIKQEYLDTLIQNMHWLGYDYSSMEKQSAHHLDYAQVFENLVNSGRIYPCYETRDELEFKRNKLIKQKLPPIYDRAMLSISKEQEQEYLKAGRKPHWRFKMNETKISWKDMIKEDMSFDGKNISDPIIKREDGTFLYLFPSVIDDIRMAITHIVRGEDHLTNTAIQIQMFEALGADVPTFAHLPMMTNIAGDKFSKRNNTLSIKNLQEEGIHPMAINNYLASIGTGEENLYKTLEKMVNTFDINKYNSATAKFSLEKLAVVNNSLMHLYSYEEVKNYLNDNKINTSEEIWELIKNNLVTILDIEAWNKIINSDLNFTAEDNKNVIGTALEILPNSFPLSLQTWQDFIKNIKSKISAEGKELFLPLRLAVTGKQNGPELIEIFNTLGYEKVLYRLKNVEII